MKTKKINSIKKKITEYYYKTKRQRIFSKIKIDESNEDGYKILEEILDSIKESD